jgi:hypothetical protein
MLSVFDPESGEVLEPNDFLRDLEQLSDQDLLDLITAVEALVKELAPVLSLLKSTMFHRMEADQATLRETPGYTVKLVPDRAYEYDLAKLLTIKSLITPAQYAATFKETITPNKTELNKLVKLGGQLRTIIEASINEVKKPPKLEITRKQEVPQVG